MTHDFDFSSSPAIIWPLVLHSIIFGAHLISLQAIILIFKHATFLRLDGLSSESALTQAELDYREANIDLKIRQHLEGSSENSVEVSASFLMATDIEASQSLANVHAHGIEHWFTRLLRPAFPRKS
ncbi:hypothetical protein EDB86DRAFT_3083144 [Lactarius hatsudake]|nr:hypothetical protein EDB86DRAFT_3083144 [Lactarius hatsudake]